MRLSDDSAGGDRPIVPVICGPTGAGKSAVAMWLADRFPTDGCTLISADSRQIYRGLDIGTAKPTAADRGRVPHLGLDIVDPRDRYSAARWAEAAGGWITDAVAVGHVPLIVGGTGLYLRALFNGLFVEPSLDPRRRQALSALLGKYSTEELRPWVVRLDPARAHFGRTQLLRAIEIALLTGTPISRLHLKGTDAPWRARMLVVDPGPVLAERNERRVDAMLAAGWLDEARALMRDVPDDAPAWNAAGYGVMRRLASGELDLPSAREAIVIETRQYVKRQRTWFRHQLDAHAVTHLDPSAPGWERQADAWWKLARGSR